MSKKIQLLVSFIMLLCCICAIVYSINFKREVNERKSDKEVYTNLQEYKNIENTDIYDEFLKNFDTQGEKYYYSFVELVGYDYPILLLSDGVYKFINESEVAMWTDIYYPINNEITKFGTIMSDGTAYPISANTTGIFTAGGHEVAKYDLDIQNRKLRLISKYIMFFHKVEQEVKAITVGIIGNENKIVSQEDFDKANEEYGNANIVYFKRL
ncbi:MAG TPA: hypothetical protein VJY54_05540 [Lachnospiraceae bacterium]|nr:hypothetical protein [Lachnospiraceae bacterium]